MTWALLAAGLCGVGLYGTLTAAAPLRRLVGFNILGAGVFLCFGVVARRAGYDPVPQALVITGLVVAFAATTLAVALLRRLGEASPRAPRGGAAPGTSARGPRPLDLPDRS